MLLFFSEGWSIFVIVLLSLNFKDGLMTEISESSHIIDSSLDFDVLLPVLTCNSEESEYEKISWYKDYTLLQNGTADLGSHFLSLHSLLYSSPDLDSILKLQGYYWCVTDLSFNYVKYLFRIKRVHTYVGHLLATSDSLNSNPKFTLDEKTLEKQLIYEREMQYILFGFLPIPNTFVHKISQLGSGLKIYFYLYVQEPYLPRMPFNLDLIKDQHQLEFIDDYLNNRTETDVDYYESMLYWTESRGISISDIQLRSTRGCYGTVTLMPGGPPKEITWSYAEIGETVIPEQGCSAKNGMAVTRTCMGDFNSGAVWSVPSAKCAVEAGERTSSLIELFNGFSIAKGLNTINQLNNLTQDPDLSVTDIHIATNVLNELSLMPDLYDIDTLFSIIDNLLKTNKSNFDAAKDTISLTTRILKVIENIMDISFNENKEFQTAKSNLLAQVKSTKTAEEDHVIGIAVLSADTKKSLLNSSFELLFNKTQPLSPQTLAYFVLPMDLILQRESYLSYPCQIDFVFYRNWELFHKKIHYPNQVFLPPPVMQIGISGGPAWDLPNPVEFFFKNEYDDIKFDNPVCMHFDPRLDQNDFHLSSGWSPEGCSYLGLKDGFFHCQCNHLSIFSVGMRYYTEGSILRMHAAVYVSCGISIIALAVAVLLYLLSKVWRSTVDHHILFWLCLSFLLTLISIFISEIKTAWSHACFQKSLVFYYFVLVTFSWLLVQSVLHLLRFGKKTDASEIPRFMGKCFIAAWGIPAVIIVVVSYVKKYNFLNNCWLGVAGVTNIVLIPICCIAALTLCINISAAYAISCRFQKDFLVDDKKYNEPVIKFRVAVSIHFLFVLCWVFGYLTLTNPTKELQILFGIVSIVTAYYLTLFFIFQEISFWDLCGKQENKEATTAANDIITYNAKSYKATENQ